MCLNKRLKVLKDWAMVFSDVFVSFAHVSHRNVGMFSYVNNVQYFLSTTEPKYLLFPNFFSCLITYFCCCVDLWVLAHTSMWISILFLKQNLKTGFPYCKICFIYLSLFLAFTDSLFELLSFHFSLSDLFLLLYYFSGFLLFPICLVSF